METRPDLRMSVLGEWLVSNDYFKSVPLIKVLQERWHLKHMSSNVFRYHISRLHEKFEGDFLLRLNPFRNTKRREPENIDNILQAFDDNKFNFCKAREDEIIFKFSSERNSDEFHTLLVNVSPLSRFHCLLCPSIDSKLPQVVTLDSLEIVLEFFALANDRDLRIGFNSLCALASVNHLHYHVLIERHNLPVETVKCKNIKGPVWVTENYPIPAFCMEAIDVSNDAKNIFKVVDYLLKNSIAHNIFITRGSSFTSDNEILRVLIWPRKSSVGAKQLIAFNVAVLELSGWFTIYNEDDYNMLKAVDLERELVKWKIDNFDEICKGIEELF